jgi:hypothetical protein
MKGENVVEIWLMFFPPAQSMVENRGQASIGGFKMCLPCRMPWKEATMHAGTASISVRTESDAFSPRVVRALQSAKIGKIGKIGIIAFFCGIRPK